MRYSYLTIKEEINKR